jgi:soluble lytic murein transglycosylase-like protein
MLVTSRPAAADIYTHLDKQGVVHFTNIPRPGRKWKRIMRTGPGKARSVHARRRSSRRLDAKRHHRYDQHVQRAAALYHIPVALVRAVMTVESDFDPRAVSRAGARGLMQLMPATAQGMGVVDSFDPRQNIFGGTRYLRVLANRFDGDLVFTIASYHAGPGAVRKYGGIPPYRTTQRYVRMVLSRYFRLRRKAAAGPRPALRTRTAKPHPHAASEHGAKSDVPL